MRYTLQVCFNDVAEAMQAMAELYSCRDLTLAEVTIIDNEATDRDLRSYSDGYMEGHRDGQQAAAVIPVDQPGWDHVWLEASCPLCRSVKGRPCVDKQGRDRAVPHAARWAANRPEPTTLAE